MSKAKQNTRNKIIEAAKSLFIENGVNETTIQSIARKAGVDRKTVYNNFADKEDILKVLANDYSSKELNFDVDIRNLTGLESLKLYMNFMFDHLLLYRELMLLTSQFDDSNPDYHSFLGANNHERLKENLIFQFIEKGINDYSIDLKGLKTHEFMIIMILPLFSGMQKFYKKESIFNSEFRFEVETFRKYIEIFLKGVEKESN